MFPDAASLFGGGRFINLDHIWLTKYLGLIFLDKKGARLFEGGTFIFPPNFPGTVFNWGWGVGGDTFIHAVCFIRNRF